MQIRKPRTATSKWNVLDENRKTVKSKELDEINQLVRSKVITPADAYQKIMGLVRKWTGQDTPSNTDNMRIGAWFWGQIEGRRRVDPNTAKYDVDRAIRALGPVSIVSGTEQEILKQTNQFHGNANRRIVRVLNSIFKALKRDIELIPDKKVKPHVKFITEEQLLQILPYLHRREWQVLVCLAFYSGGRIGELMALTPFDVRQDGVWFAKQIDRHMREKTTKNTVERLAYIIERGKPYLTEYLQIKQNITKEDRLKTRWLAKACKKAKVPSIKFHDLRHSYAIYLCSKGVGLTHVAQYLGVSVEVAQEHYVGFLATSDSIKLTKLLLSSYDESHLLRQRLKK